VAIQFQASECMPSVDQAHLYEIQKYEKS